MPSLCGCEDEKHKNYIWLIELWGNPLLNSLENMLDYDQPHEYHVFVHVHCAS